MTHSSHSAPQPSMTVYLLSLRVLLLWPNVEGDLVRVRLPPSLGRVLYILVSAMEDDVAAGEDATMRGYRHHDLIVDAIAELNGRRRVDVPTVAAYIYKIGVQLRAAAEEQFPGVEVEDLFTGDAGNGTRVTRADIELTKRAR